MLETQVLRLIGCHEQEIIEQHAANKQEYVKNVEDNLEVVEVQGNSGREEETDVNVEKEPNRQWRKVEKTTNQRSDA